MKANQNIVVGGALNGNRQVFAALPANEAIMRYCDLKRQGYTQITMTDAESGYDYDVGKFTAATTGTKQ